jgi:hypothetical protein
LKGIITPLATLQAGRNVTAATFLATLLLTILMAWQRKARWATVLAPLPLFLMPELWNTFYKFVPDYPALALTLVGWCLVGPVQPPSNLKNKYGRLPGAAAAFAAVICWAGALYFKPTTALIGPVGYWIETWVAARETKQNSCSPQHKREISPTLIIAGWAFVAVTVGASGYAVTHGLLWLNIVHSNFGSFFSPAVLVGIFATRSWTTWTVYFVVAIGAAMYWKQIPLFRVWPWLLALEFCFMMKQGADINYNLGSLCVGGVAIAVAAGKLTTNALQRRHFPLIISVLLAWSIALATHMPLTLYRYYDGRFVTPINVNQLDTVLGKYPADKTLVLDPFYAMMRRRPFPYADGYHAAILEKRGELNFSKTASAVKTRQYKVIITDPGIFNPPQFGTGFMPESIAAALRAQYTPARKIGLWFIVWLPKR